MVLRANTDVLFSFVAKYTMCCIIADVPGQGRGSMDAYIWIPVESQFSVSKFQDYHVLPEVSHGHAGPAKNHHSNVRFSGQNCSDGTTGIPHHLRKTATTRTEVQCPLSYLHEDNRCRRQSEEAKAEYFPPSWELHIFTVWDYHPILTFLSRLLRHACQITVLQFFVPLLALETHKQKTYI
jgi:hypothetical protein